jgi:spoIIIJ-associated protein
MDPLLLKQTAVELLEALGASVESVEVSSGHRTVVAVRAPDSPHLIGPRGEHLQALNTVLRRLVERKAGEDATGFLLDINGHHEAQMEQVRAQARMLAQRARLFKHDVELPPQSSYERLVVHELFADDSDIETRSEGEGKFRHVVLKYKAKFP